MLKRKKSEVKGQEQEIFLPVPEENRERRSLAHESHEPLCAEPKPPLFAGGAFG